MADGRGREPGLGVRDRILILPRERLPSVAADLAGARGRLAGMWALEALRIAGHRPRFGTDTDHRTIPHEVGWIETAVHLSKGCYRGQETVARVHNLGHPPRRLVLLHLDGSEDRLPAHGDPVSRDGDRRSASSARPPGTTSSGRSRWPWSSGPSRSTPRSLAGGISAAQEVIVSPDAGANVKITLTAVAGRRVTAAGSGGLPDAGPGPATRVTCAGQGTTSLLVEVHRGAAPSAAGRVGQPDGSAGSSPPPR